MSLGTGSTRAGSRTRPALGRRGCGRDGRSTAGPAWRSIQETRRQERMGRVYARAGRARRRGRSRGGGGRASSRDRAGAGPASRTWELRPAGTVWVSREVARRSCASSSPSSSPALSRTRPPAAPANSAGVTRSLAQHPRCSAAPRSRMGGTRAFDRQEDTFKPPSRLQDQAEQLCRVSGYTPVPLSTPFDWRQSSQRLVYHVRPRGPVRFSRPPSDLEGA